MCFSLINKCQGYSIKDSLDICNLPILDTEINSKKVSFIVDTGASTNFIDSSYYENNLKASYKIEEDKVEIYAPNSCFTSTQSVDLDFKVGNATYTSKFLFVDFTSQFTFLHEQYNLNRTVCGVLGNQFLQDNKCIIDYKHKKIKL